MTLTTLFGLTLALIVIAATPGPGVLMTVTRSLQAGFWAGFWVVAGIVFMDLVVLLLTLSGLSLVAHWSATSFMVISWLGAAFLVWLAWQNWRRPPLKMAEIHIKGHRDFMTGIAVSLTNPVLFYLAFLPAFIDISALTWIDGLLLVFLITITLSVVLLGYALMATKLQPLLFKGNGQRQIWLNRASATVLLILALSLVFHNL